jgi:hypothetical protein
LNPRESGKEANGFESQDRGGILRDPLMIRIRLVGFGVRLSLPLEKESPSLIPLINHQPYSVCMAVVFQRPHSHFRKGLAKPRSKTLMVSMGLVQVNGLVIQQFVALLTDQGSKCGQS